MVNLIKRYSPEELKALIYSKDRLRSNYDIRSRPVKDLTRYQQMQLRDVKKQLYDMEMIQLQKAIFRTFEDWEIKQIVDYEPMEIC